MDPKQNNFFGKDKNILFLFLGPKIKILYRKNLSNPFNNIIFQYKEVPAIQERKNLFKL
jgi:hypothetical protein